MEGEGQAPGQDDRKERSEETSVSEQICRRVSANAFKLVVEFEQEPDARGLHLDPVVLLAGPGAVPVHPRLGQHHSRYDDFCIL